jgi:Outer membrane protein and related peptidoglycan-associated (lipo)proteins
MSRKRYTIEQIIGLLRKVDVKVSQGKNVGQICQESVIEPAPAKEKVTITLNVQFDTNKAVVKEKYHDDVKRVADFMKEFPDTTAAIEGHTDNVASAAYNQKLSEKRANSVRQYIIDKFGIDGSRLTATGYGMTKPIASNDTEEGRQKNRRVQAVIKTIKTN